MGEETQTMLRGLWHKFDRDWGWNLARLLAYACIQMLFAVVGLQLIALALVLRLTSPALEQDVTLQIVHFLPDHTTAVAVSSLAHTLETAPGWILIAGLPIVVWEGTRFFVVLESVLCIIFRRHQRRFLAQNRAALAMMLLFALLLPVIVLSATALPPLGITASYTHSLSGGLARYNQDPLVATLGFFGGIAANFLLLVVAYRWITPGGISLRGTLPGAAVGACLAQLYLLIFPFYTHNVLHPDHFGTVAGFVLVILVFFFAYALFIVVGAELASWHEGYRAAARDIPSTLLLADISDISDIPATPPTRLNPSAEPRLRSRAPAELAPYAPATPSEIA